MKGADMNRKAARARLELAKEALEKATAWTPVDDASYYLRQTLRFTLQTLDVVLSDD